MQKWKIAKLQNCKICKHAIMQNCKHMAPTTLDLQPKENSEAVCRYWKRHWNDYQSEMQWDERMEPGRGGQNRYFRPPLAAVK